MTRVLIVLFTFVLPLSVTAQARLVEEGRSTIERMNTMLQKSITEVIRQVPADSISVRVAPHPDADFIRVMAIDALGARTVITGTSTTVLVGTSTDADLFITPVDVSTRYEATDAADSLDRVLSVTLKAVLTENGNTKALHTESLTERERMHRTDALRLQSMQRSSTYAQIPPMTTTFWDDVLQPAIFVAAAVTTVLLLFTVRSQ